MKMVKITNPEKQLSTTPKKFSGFSEIVDIEKTDLHRGIILDSLEEFAQSIRVYDGGSVQGARATQNNLMDAVGDLGGGMGAGLLLLSGAENSRGFTEELVQEAVTSLKDNKRFSRNFDYDAMGTNFFKTTLVGEKIGDKYVLEINAAFVGREPEEKLAKTIEKPMALVNSSVRGILSVVDDWWVNVNLENMVRDMPLPKEALRDVNDWAKYFAAKSYGDKEPKFDFEYNDKKFTLNIDLDIVKHLMPEKEEQGTKYIQARGSSIVGGAWKNWDKEGKKVDPILIKPALVFSVSSPGEGYFKSPSVTTEEISAVREARDYIANILKKRIIPQK